MTVTAETAPITHQLIGHLTPETQDPDGNSYLLCRWEHVDQLSDNLERQILESGQEFDVVIIAERGGRFGKDRFRKYGQSMYPVQTIRYAGTQSQGDEIRFAEGGDIPPDVDLTGKRILIIEDIADKGKSLEFFDNYFINERGAASVSVATLYQKSQTTRKAEFVGQEIDHRTWVVFPWIWDMAEFFAEKLIRAKSWAGRPLAISILNLFAIEFTQEEILTTLSKENQLFLIDAIWRMNFPVPKELFQKLDSATQRALAMLKSIEDDQSALSSHSQA